jgi:hypothetical protein
MIKLRKMHGIVKLVNKVVFGNFFHSEMNIRTVNARELEGLKTCQLKNMKENTRLKIPLNYQLY